MVGSKAGGNLGRFAKLLAKPVNKLGNDLVLRAGSCAIDFTQLGHQKCFGTK